MAERLPGHSDRVKDLFDAKASSWSAKYAPSGRLTGRLSRIHAVLEDYVHPGSSVLDLGCGSGDIARAVASAEMQVTGCDISREMLRCALREDVESEIKWLQLDTNWRKLPFGASGFDAIIAVSVFEYVENPAAVICECARVLKPGGVLLCTVPDVTHPVRWIEWAAGLPLAALRAADVARPWPRLDNYLMYLRTSRHRHFAGWWSRAAVRNGLERVPNPRSAGEKAPLRLLVFQRPSGNGIDGCRVSIPPS